MPSTLTYPGVYIEEVPSPVRTIAGVATSITAFIGRTLKGPVDTPVRVQSYAEFERRFGGLWRDSPLSYSAQHYFANGGTDAIIVRVFRPEAALTIANHTARATVITSGGAGGSFEIEAFGPGGWGEELQIEIDQDTPIPDVFNLSVGVDEDGEFIVLERFRNVSVDETSSRYVEKVLEGSELVRAADLSSIGAGDTNADVLATTTMAVDGGVTDANGRDVTDTEVVGTLGSRTGIHALEEANIFNLMVVPPVSRTADFQSWDDALTYCKTRRAMLLVDPPSSWNTTAQVTDETPGNGVINLVTADRDAMFFFPRVRMRDPLQENRLETFTPSGAVAGIIARTDTQRGVWKAAAGQDAAIVGARELSYVLTDEQIGQLNPLGANCLKIQPAAGPVVWGARTREGDDRRASQWKYSAIRRTALLIEESLYRGTQWVIFEPNDEPLWSQIRLNVGAFMNNLFRQGAFQGTKARDAYFVKCDQETTTQNDIDRGVVNLLVGFAPLKPTEFLVIKISQMAGNIQT